MNIINFLKTHEDARKVFGKKELLIIEKQLLGIRLTQSEKNRLSRDIRRKLKFIADIEPLKKDFKLDRGVEIKRIIDATLKFIFEDSSANNIKRIILFGSAIKNRLTFRSDIDIAVEFRKVNLKQATLFRKRILGKTPSRVDLQVFNFLPDKIKNEVDRGRILYENRR